MTGNYIVQLKSRGPWGSVPGAAPPVHPQGPHLPSRRSGRPGQSPQKLQGPESPRHLLPVPLQKGGAGLCSRSPSHQRWLLAQGTDFTPTLPISTALLQVWKSRRFHSIPFSKQCSVPDIQMLRAVSPSGLPSDVFLACGHGGGVCHEEASSPHGQGRSVGAASPAASEGVWGSRLGSGRGPPSPGVVAQTLSSNTSPGNRQRGPHVVTRTHTGQLPGDGRWPPQDTSSEGLPGPGPLGRVPPWVGGVLTPRRGPLCQASVGALGPGGRRRPGDLVFVTVTQQCLLEHGPPCRGGRLPGRRHTAAEGAGCALRGGGRGGGTGGVHE